jgi:hypothetical protein
MGPREELEAARTLEDLASPAIYLLTDTIDGQNDVRRVYVGEAEDFCERGIERNDRLSDWEHFIAFYSKDTNLTKAHVRWLEREVYLRLQNATGRAIVANGNTPPGASLPMADDAAMQTYLENMLYVMTALGLDFFSARTRSQNARAADEKIEHTDPERFADERYVLATKAGGEAKAIAVRQGRIWILQPGSKVSPSIGSLPDGYTTLRQALIDRNLIEPTEDGFLTVRSPIEFTSPSASAAIVRGYAINGKWEWKRERDNMRFSDVLAQGPI